MPNRLTVVPDRAKVPDVAEPTDNLNRDAVHALMEALGVDGYAQLAKRTDLERSFISRVMRGERTAQPSTIIAIARALKVPTIAITGQGIDIAAQEIIDEAVA